MPVCAVHAPCLLFTQRVWGTEPWGKLERSAEMAHAVGAEVVVVHPPFRWQRDYASEFVDGIAALENSTGIAFAVENMYPWRARQAARRRGVRAGLRPVRGAVRQHHDRPPPRRDRARRRVEMAERLGDRLRHVHLTDGTGSAKDEHLVPGRGAPAPARSCATSPTTGFGGEVVVEINTRRCSTREERETDLRESLAFAREHLAVSRRAR